MKNSEKIIVAIGVILLSVAIYMVFLENDDEEVAGAVVVAKVTEVQGDAKKKEFEAVGWKLLQEDDRIYQNDRIFTLDDSFLKIVFIDGTVLNLTPNTLLLMVQEGESLDLDLQKGFLGLELKDIKNQLTVKLGEKKVGLNSNDAKIHLSSGEDGEQEFGMTVVSGVANLKFNNEEKVIKKGERVEIGKETTKIEIETFGISPVRPEGEHIIIRDDKKMVELAWESTEEMESYNVTTARDPQFKKIIKKESTKGKSASIEISDEGHYFWKVKGVKNSKETQEAPVSTFQASRDVAPHLLFPPENGAITLERNSLKKNVTLRWKKGRDEKFQIEFFRNGADQAKGDLLESTSDYLEISELGPQVYKWRVRALDPKRQDTLWSDYRTFSLVEPEYQEGTGPDGPRRMREFYDEATGEWKMR